MTLAGTAPNPLREGSVTLRAADPCTIVVFGATGDLTHRKLLPALHRLARQRLLHPMTSIVGYARQKRSDEVFRNNALEAMGTKTPPEDWARFASSLHYHVGTFENVAEFRDLAKRLERSEKERGVPANRLFYFAAPPSTYETILRNLKEGGLVHPPSPDGAWSRVVIEKPFGHDHESARELNRRVHEVFDESQVFRIDHYLGKETVQNILVLRLANGIFEPLWNNRYLDHVQITVAESVGVEGRAGYYEHAGVIRDMLQNHMMQLLTLTAMEPPVRFDADAVRDEKVKVLRALRPLTPEDVRTRTVRAQYAAGATGGVAAPGYREERGVAPDSDTDTYLAVRFEIDNWRWAGVPFYLRSGKRLPKRATEVAIVFKQPPYALFRSAGCADPQANVLRLRIQPDEGISFSFGSKSPGQALHIDPVRMDFYYLTSFGADPPEAYERLLLDCNLGDSTLFARKDEVELAWEHVDGIAKVWRSEGSPPLLTYPAGTWGPPEADALPGREGRAWYRL
jgi:glucose-6-phosphate 1-dehydrogenase